jgi:hypothetical protein
MSKLQEIYDGWKNLIIPEEKLKPHIEKVAKARLNICNTCEFDSLKDESLKLRFDRHCTNCGCTLAAKTRSLTSSCPIDKWKAEVK